jgi:3-oxoadipate enol-lactonase
VAHSGVSSGWADDVRASDCADYGGPDSLDAAVEVNLSWWVDGPHRRPDRVDPEVRGLVACMQRRAFEVTPDWDDVEEKELETPALDRLGEISVPVLVLVGGVDLDTVHDAAGGA